MKMGDHNVPGLHPMTPPANDAYRDGWEAIFGKQTPMESAEALVSLQPKIEAPPTEAVTCHCGRKVLAGRTWEALILGTRHFTCSEACSMQLEREACGP